MATTDRIVVCSNCGTPRPPRTRCRPCTRRTKAKAVKRMRQERSETFLARRRSIQKRHDSKPENRIKQRARGQVATAIKSGRLIRQPCETCGAAKSQAHHDDYSKPLDVRWLCSPCHARIHTDALPDTVPVQDNWRYAGATK